MSSLHGLSREVAQLRNQVQPPQPTIIDCTGAKEKLLAKLAAIRANTDEHETQPLSPEELQQFKECLRERVMWMEQAYHVQFRTHE